VTQVGVEEVPETEGDHHTDREAVRVRDGLISTTI
jgi:hypothetical protein